MFWAVFWTHQSFNPNDIDSFMWLLLLYIFFLQSIVHGYTIYYSIWIVYKHTWYLLILLLKLIYVTGHEAVWTESRSHYAQLISVLTGYKNTASHRWELLIFSSFQNFSSKGLIQNLPNGKQWKAMESFLLRSVGFRSSGWRRQWPPGELHALAETSTLDSITRLLHRVFAQPRFSYSGFLLPAGRQSSECFSNCYRLLPSHWFNLLRVLPCAAKFIAAESHPWPQLLHQRHNDCGIPLLREGNIGVSILFVLCDWGVDN